MLPIPVALAATSACPALITRSTSLSVALAVTLVGLGLKTELGVGPVGLEWENWLIVDKIVDRWLFAYNLHLGADSGAAIRAYVQAAQKAAPAN